jgi:transposase
VVGVDTHADVHVAAALDQPGRLLGRLEVAASTWGYAQLLRWAQTFSSTTMFAVERTGAYGAGLAPYLMDAGCVVIEINVRSHPGAVGSRCLSSTFTSCR